MKKWPLLLIHALEAAIVLTVIYYEPTYGVRGVVHREAYFEGKPTSYWRDEIGRWQVRKSYFVAIENGRWIQPNFFSRTESWYQKNRKRWLPRQDDGIHEAFLILVESSGPSILQGGDDARRVLETLLDDPSPKVRLLAQIGLGMNPPIPDDAD